MRVRLVLWVAAIAVGLGSVGAADAAFTPDDHYRVKAATDVQLSPDGSHVFVGNRHQAGVLHDHAGGKPTAPGTVVSICVASRSVDTVLSVGNYAAGLGMTPVRSRGAAGGSCS